MAQREAMSALIRELRAAVTNIAESFQLPREEQDPARKMIGLLGVTWEGLEELRSRRLKAYGDVDLQLEETLDPWVEQLTRLVLALEAVVYSAESENS